MRKPYAVFILLLQFERQISEQSLIFLNTSKTKTEQHFGRKVNACCHHLATLLTQFHLVSLQCYWNKKGWKSKMMTFGVSLLVSRELKTGRHDSWVMVVVRLLSPPPRLGNCVIYRPLISLGVSQSTLLPLFCTWLVNKFIKPHR